MTTQQNARPPYVSFRGIWDNFWDVVVNHYADFSGTATRREFWTFYLTRFVATFLLGILVVIPVLGALALAVFTLGTAIPTLGIGARRLHEIGRSGYWQALPLAATPFLFKPAAFAVLAVVLAIPVIVMLCLSPKDTAQAEAETVSPEPTIGPDAPTIPAVSPEMQEALTSLAKLHKWGTLTDEEYAAKRDAIINHQCDEHCEHLGGHRDEEAHRSTHPGIGRRPRAGRVRLTEPA